MEHQKIVKNWFYKVTTWNAKFLFKYLKTDILTIVDSVLKQVNELYYLLSVIGILILRRKMSVFTVFKRCKLFLLIKTQFFVRKEQFTLVISTSEKFPSISRHFNFLIALINSSNHPFRNQPSEFVHFARGQGKSNGKRRQNGSFRNLRVDGEKGEVSENNKVF